MTTRGTSRLMNLSLEAVKLINQGIYSLYSLRAGSAPGAAYVLYTPKRSYLLNDTGVVVKEESPNFRVSVEKPINFIDSDGTAHFIVKKFA